METYRTREAFLAHLPRKVRCAEIGVFQGSHAKMIAEMCEPSELVLVDHWQVSAHFPNLSKEVREAQFVDVAHMFLGKPNIRLFRTTSLEAARQFPDGYFSWVYIDADHNYEAVLADCGAWWPKVRDVLCGHDYDSWDQPAQTCRVKEAVDEFCRRVRRSLSACAVDADRAWAIRKGAE